MKPTSGRLASVNVGTPRPVVWHDRIVQTAIFKFPVEGPVPVRGVNVTGDDQADRAVHGGPDKAVYAYAQEDIAWWAGELGRPLPSGVFGENLTVADVEVTNAVVGERWRIGRAVLEVCAPRIPCYKIGIRLGDDGFPRRFAAAGRPGAYLRILAEGEVAAGDALTVEHVPEHGLTVGDVARAYHHDRSRLADLLAAPELAEGWVEWTQSLLAHRVRKP